MNDQINQYPPIDPDPDNTRDAWDIWNDPTVEVEVCVEQIPVIAVRTEFLMDDSISHRTRGALLRLMAANTPANQESIRLELGFGDTVMRDFIKESKEAGYMRVTKIPPRPGRPRFTYRYQISQTKEFPVQTRRSFSTPREQPPSDEHEETPVQTKRSFQPPTPYKQINQSVDTNTSEISQSDNEDGLSIEKPTNQGAQQKYPRRRAPKRSKWEKLQEHLKSATGHRFIGCSKEEADEATESLMPIFIGTKKHQDMNHQRILIAPKMDLLHQYARSQIEASKRPQSRTAHQVVMDALGRFRGMSEAESIASCWVENHMDTMRQYVYDEINILPSTGLERWR